MESMSLDGNLERKIVLDKICQQSKKDETGRRHSFRISQVEIQRDLQSIFLTYYFRKNSRRIG